MRLGDYLHLKEKEFILHIYFSQVNALRKGGLGAYCQEETYLQFSRGENTEVMLIKSICAGITCLSVCYAKSKSHIICFLPFESESEVAQSVFATPWTVAY